MDRYSSYNDYSMIIWFYNSSPK